MLVDSSNNSHQKEKNETEARILHAAEREFLTKGYAGARTISIAKEAGVTHAMLHYYFRSKENLFSKVISDRISELINAFVVSFEDDGNTLEECLKNGIGHHFDFVRNNPEIPRFLVCEVYKNSDLLNILGEKIKELAIPIIKHLQRKIDLYADKGECRRVDARELITDIISLNVFPIVGLHLINLVDKALESDSGHFLEHRKQANINTILSKLKP